MKQISQQLILKALLFGIISTFPLCIQPTLTPKSALPFLVKADLTYHLVSSLRKTPTAKKGALAMLGFFAGIYTHKER